jgi:transposase, IS30 family
MGAQRRRRSDQAGRPAMRSPGRPPVARRENRQRFWAAIARGLSSEDAGVVAGVSPAVGSRWFREGGGMSPISCAALSGRYLSFAEREEIAILRAGDCSVREIARRLGRSPSTVSRELRRNAATRSGYLQYRATTAQWHARSTWSASEAGQAGRERRAEAIRADRLAGTVTSTDGQHDTPMCRR